MQLVTNKLRVDYDDYSHKCIGRIFLWRDSKWYFIDQSAKVEFSFCSVDLDIFLIFQCGCMSKYLDVLYCSLMWTKLNTVVLWSCAGFGGWEWPNSSDVAHGTSVGCWHCSRFDDATLLVHRSLLAFSSGGRHVVGKAEVPSYSTSGIRHR